MMVQRSAAFLILLGLAGWASMRPALAEKLAAIQQSGLFNICANPAALPYSNDDPALHGFQLELHQEIARRLGWQGTVTWIHNRFAARRAECGGFMGRLIAPNMLPAENSLTTSPYMGSGYVIVLPPGSRNDYESLRAVLDQPPFRDGKRMGIFLGASIGGRIEQAGVRTLPYFGQEEIIEAVLGGEVAGGVVAREDAYWYLTRHPGAIVVFDIFRVDSDFRWNVGLGMRNADPPLIEAINGALGQVLSDHTLEQILAKYGIEYLPPFPQDHS